MLVGASRSEKIFIFLVDYDHVQQKYSIKMEKEIFVEKNVFCLYVDCFMRN